MTFIIALVGGTWGALLRRRGIYETLIGLHPHLGRPFYLPSYFQIFGPIRIFHPIHAPFYHYKGHFAPTFESFA